MTEMDFNSCVGNFHRPNNPEKSDEIKKQNQKDFKNIAEKISQFSIASKAAKLDGWRDGHDTHLYDDDFTRTVAEELLDRISATPFFGDILRSSKLKIVKRVNLNTEHLIKHVLQRTTSEKRISRNDIAEMTAIQKDQWK